MAQAYNSRESSSSYHKRRSLPDILPKLVVFDLDATLWYPEMYMLSGGSPFKKDSASGDVIDSNGQKVRLMGHSRSILYELATSDTWADIQIGIASCTDEPSWAEECLQKIEVGDGLKMKQVFSVEEIHYGSKATHFKNLKKKTGIDFKDMIFFDNERGNIRNVSALGVHSVYVPDGMTEENWYKGLRDYANNHSS